MKLELKYLAPYLPYGLKIDTLKLENGYSIMTMCDKGGLSNISIGDVMDEYPYTKPILRPLSDLTKEIVVNGEKFVPLQKLCRLFAYNEQYKKDWIFNFEENYTFNGGSDRYNFNKELIYFCSASDSIMTREFGYYSISKKFYLKNNRDKEDLTHVVNQYDAMQKLFEWHFDVFGLIEAGLAIDINTLSE